MDVQIIDRDGNESVVTISYKIKFIDSARFMASSISNLVDNLAESKRFDSFLQYERVKEYLKKHK